MQAPRSTAKSMGRTAVQLACHVQMCRFGRGVPAASEPGHGRRSGSSCSRREPEAHHREHTVRTWTVRSEQPGRAAALRPWGTADIKIYYIKLELIPIYPVLFFTPLLRVNRQCFVECSGFGRHVYKVWICEMCRLPAANCRRHLHGCKTRMSRYWRTVTVIRSDSDTESRQRCHVCTSAGPTN